MLPDGINHRLAATTSLPNATTPAVPPLQRSTSVLSRLGRFINTNPLAIPGSASTPFHTAERLEVELSEKDSRGSPHTVQLDFQEREPSKGKQRSKQIERLRDENNLHAKSLFGLEFLAETVETIKLSCFYFLEAAYNPSHNLQGGIIMNFPDETQLRATIRRAKIERQVMTPYRDRLEYTKTECPGKYIEALLEASNSSLSSFAKTLHRIHSRKVLTLLGAKKNWKEILEFIDLLDNKLDDNIISAVNQWSTLMRRMHAISAFYQYTWSQSLNSKAEFALNTAKRDVVIFDIIRHGKHLFDLYINQTKLADTVPLEGIIHSIHNAGFSVPLTQEEALRDAKTFESDKFIPAEPILRLLGMRSWRQAEEILRQEFTYLYESPFKMRQAKGVQITIDIASKSMYQVIQRKFFQLEPVGVENHYVEKKMIWALFEFTWIVAPSLISEAWTAKLNLVHWEISKEALYTFATTCSPTLPHA